MNSNNNMMTKIWIHYFFNVGRIGWYDVNQWLRIGFESNFTDKVADLMTALNCKTSRHTMYDYTSKLSVVLDCHGYKYRVDYYHNYYPMLSLPNGNLMVIHISWNINNQNCIIHGYNVMMMKSHGIVKMVSV